MATKKTSPAKTAARQLPLSIRESDLKFDYKLKVPYEALREINREMPTRLTLYKTDKHWVVCTLHISNASKRQAAGTPARTYAIGVDDKKIYTVGRGPHVTDEITVNIYEDNLERLRPLIDLYLKGLAEASQIRDRISSRRAQGQAYRAAGRSSWMW